MSILEKIDYGKSPIFWVFVIEAVAVVAVFYLLLNEIGISIFIGVIIVGTSVLLWNDYTEKKKTAQQEEAKMESLIRRKKEQAEAEQNEGKCISCLEPLPQGAKECPNCGFKVKHYKLEETEETI